MRFQVKHSCASSAFVLALACSSYAEAVLLTLNTVSLARGTDYSVSSAGCTPRTLGFVSTVILNGGFDGFDCGLNVPVGVLQPGLVTLPDTGTSLIKLGEAALNERALITLGLFPKGDGTSLANLGMTLTFNVNGTPFTFNGTATNYVGGAAAFGDAALIAACADPTQVTFPQCVNDTPLDFRVAFAGTQSLVLGASTLVFSIDPLEFFNNTSAVNVNARVVVTPAAIPEPGLLALFGAALAAFLFGRKRPAGS